MKNQIYKTEFIDTYAKENGITKKQAGEEIDRFLGTLYNILASGTGIRFTNFGTFAFRQTKPSAAVVQIGPRKGETVIIPEHYMLKFVPCEALRQTIKSLDVD